MQIRSILTICAAQEWDPPSDWLSKRNQQLSAQSNAGTATDQGPSSLPPSCLIPPSWRFDPYAVTHVITATIQFPEYDGCGDPQADGIAEEADPVRATVVSPHWVYRSYVLGARQAERYFSPDPARIFSGMVVHPSRLSTSEAELILAAVGSLGGHYRLNLTKEVTHLITPLEDSTKLRTLRQPAHAGLGILAVHPAWINECIKFNLLLSPDPFLWPLDHPGPPPFLAGNARPPFSSHIAPPSHPPTKEEHRLAGDKATSPNVQLSARRAGLASTTPAPASERDLSSLVPARRDLNMLFTSPDSPSNDGTRDKSTHRSKHPELLRSPSAFRGLNILFIGDGLGKLSPSSLETLAANVHGHGGKWVEAPTPNDEGDLAQAVNQADVVITTYRDVPAAFWALHLGKRLATIAWLWYVMVYGRLVEPMDNILHYPSPKAPIAGFEGYNFTLSNYTGEARTYLKELIRRAGGVWTPEMSARNTHLITASTQGEKVRRAPGWGIKVTNHTWLEDCFVTWSDRDVSQSKLYTQIPSPSSSPLPSPLPAGSPSHPRGPHANVQPRVSSQVRLQETLGHVRLDRDVLRPWIILAKEWVDRQTKRAYDSVVHIPVQSDFGSTTKENAEENQKQKADTAEESNPDVLHQPQTHSRDRPFSIPEPASATEREEGAVAQEDPEAEASRGHPSPAQKSGLVTATLSPATVAPQKRKRGAPKKIDKESGVQQSTDQGEGTILRSPSPSTLHHPSETDPPGLPPQRQVRKGREAPKSVKATASGSRKTKSGKRTSPEDGDEKGDAPSDDQDGENTKPSHQTPSTSHRMRSSRTLASPAGDASVSLAIESPVRRKRAKPTTSTPQMAAAAGSPGNSSESKGKSRARNHVAQASPDPAHSGFGTVSGSPAQPHGSEAKPPGKQFYTTTSVEMSTSDERVLKKLGWHKQAEVTAQTSVLVAASLSRTPKLLCAIARGVEVVSHTWVKDMVEHLSPRNPIHYALQDKPNERLRGMKLADVLAIRRARGNTKEAKGILAGHTFLFTPKVKPSDEVLRGIVVAAGGKAPKRSSVDVEGQVLPHPQTVHLISSEEDRRLWANLEEDTCEDGSPVRVWNTELILDGVLHQQLDWNKHKLLG